MATLPIIPSLNLTDIRECTDAPHCYTLFSKLNYPVLPVAPLPIEWGSLPGMLRDAVMERYLIADIAHASEEPLTVTLFVLRQLPGTSAYVRGIAQQWTRRFAGMHLLLFAVSDGEDSDTFRHLTFVNTRRLGDGAQIRIKLHKLIVDRASPTRHDLDTLNSIALNKQIGLSATKLYQAQCAAFDIERITNDFYKDYTALFKAVKTRILQENQHFPPFSDPVRLHTFTQRLFGRLMFLYFLQKKGALNGDPHFVTKHYTTCLEDGRLFYTQMLEPLFFQTLNRPHGETTALFGRVPYLNGGLFAPDKDDYYDDQSPTTLTSEGKPYVPDEIFDPRSPAGLLYFLNTHNFTIEEDTPLEVEVALDPEMLGKVFENLLEEEERGKTGTFYTPRPVVAFMCRQALTHYLAAIPHLSRERLEWLLDEAETGEAPHDDAGNMLLTNRNVARSLREHIEQALKDVRILDPAVGSGAFLLGMLALLIGVRRALYRIAEARLDANSALVEGWKRDAIRDCLYGVDIKREAIEIARLRLWLSLVVDADPFTMEPLPNLDYKLMDGDSLIETFEGVQIFPTRLNEGDSPVLMRNEQTLALVAQLKDQQCDYFQPASLDQRNVLKQQIHATELAIVDAELQARDAANASKLDMVLKKMAQLQGKTLPKDLVADQERLTHAITTTKQALADLNAGVSLPFFLFRLHFGNVFVEKDGFDIVIANPPYVRHEKLVRETLAALKKAYPAVQHGMADLFVYFYARALQLLRTGGTLAFISSNKFFRAGYGKGLLDVLTKQTTMRVIIDFGDAPVFDAAAYPCIIIADQGAPPLDHTYRGLTTANDIDLDTLAATFDDASQTLAQCDGVQPPSSTPATSALVAKLLQMGAPLGAYVDGKMYRGVLTGLNEAFIIDQATRDRLIAADPHSAEIIKPMLRGRDISRYAIHDAGLWLIRIESGWTRKHIGRNTAISENEAWLAFSQTYPSIAAHLESYAERARKREDQGQFWWELRSCVYYEAFEQPKIVWGNLMLFSSFTFDSQGNYICAPANIIQVENVGLLAIMNSKLINYVLRNIAIERGGNYFEAKPIYVSQLPIIEPTPTDQVRLTELVDTLQSIGGVGPEAEAMEREVDTIVYRTYRLSAGEIDEIERWHAERRALLARGKKGNRDDGSEEENG